MREPHELPVIFSKARSLLCRASPSPGLRALACTLRMSLLEAPKADPDTRLLPAVTLTLLNSFRKTKVLGVGSACTYSSSEQLGRSQHYPFLYLWSLILLLDLFAGSFEVPGSRSLEQLRSAASEDFDLSQTVTKTPLH